MSGLSLRSNFEEGRATVVLDGELDLASVGDLDAEIERLADLPEVRTVVIDLRELAFMDSSGLRSIVLADARLTERDKHFALIKGGEPVQRVFEITRMAERFRFYDTSVPAQEDAA